ncbi:hypothetical protein AB0F99_33715, partial [Nocardia testacea]
SERTLIENMLDRNREALIETVRGTAFMLRRLLRRGSPAGAGTTRSGVGQNGADNHLQDPGDRAQKFHGIPPTYYPMSGARGI